ncbi:MAG: GAF domain-containing protein [Nitrospirae bacterium]|nr:MAG: GAF domain-containing protein [Nitrospirota bacterium]
MASSKPNKNRKPGPAARTRRTAAPGPSRRASTVRVPKTLAARGTSLASGIPQHLQQVILEAMSSGKALTDVARSCLEVLLEISGMQGAWAYVRDEQTGTLRCVADCGLVDGVNEEAREKLVAQVTTEEAPVMTRDLVAYPLKRADRLEGVLVVSGLSQGKKQGGGALDILAFVATRLAAGLDHSRLAEKYAQKIVRIKYLEQVSEILNSTLDEGEVLRRAIEGAAQLVEAEAGSLLLLDERSGQLNFVVAVGEKGLQLQAIQLKSGEGVAGFVANSGQPLIVNDAQHDDRVAHQVDEQTGFRTRSLLAVPVRARGKTLGVLEAVNKLGGQPFSNWDMLEFSSLANQVAIALENSRLFQSHQQKITQLKKLQEVSQVLNSSLNQAEIRKKAIEAITFIMDAEAGSLLLLDEPAQELYFEVALGEKGEGVREIRLKVGQGIAGYVAQTGEPVIINDCQNDPRLAKQADKKSGFVTRNMVCVPVKARDKMLGVLQAINKKDGGLFSDEDLQDFVSLGHQVGIAIENANLYEEISKLFEGFISASVTAIESRDPTTSGHSGRVAVLTCGLAEVVDRADTGPYASVTFDYDQMKEIRYAAVLHDFGKVGVREHVLVKANKLMPEQLAMLKARFDFIKRTLEVQALRKKVDILMSGDRQATAELLAEVDEGLARQVADTEGILDFLLQCNKPSVLKQGGFERLNDIARLHFDYFSSPASYLTPDEVITLSIPKGSLTTEERLEIESHVTHTYKFLSTIPWTKTLQNIPIIAYGHHEKLDGSGYPRQVPGETISVQTRMMTISDIYDALTAADRPYKPAVPTPKALAILEDEVQHGKVDAQLLQVFIDAKVYERVKPS